MEMALGPETHEAWIDYSTTVLCNGHAAAYSIESPSGRYDSAASASKVERFEQDYLYGIKLASWTIMIPLFGEMNYSGMEAEIVIKR